MPTRPHRNPDQLLGGRRRDGNVQPYGGRDGRGQSLHDQRDAVTGGRARQLRHHVQHGGFHPQSKSASVTPNAAGKTYSSSNPSLTGTMSGFLDADAVTAAYSRTAGETVAASPYSIS